MTKKRLSEIWKHIRKTYFANFWDTLAWLAFAYVVLYALLKALNVIHSPTEIDVAAIVSVAYFIGKHAQKMDFSIKEIETIKHKLDSHDSRLIRIETKLS